MNGETDYEGERNDNFHNLRVADSSTFHAAYFARSIFPLFEIDALDIMYM